MFGGRVRAPTRQFRHIGEFGLTYGVALPAENPNRVGPYELVRQLAAGGMGAVYEARVRGGDAEVAIKFLHSELAADPEMNRRFRREATILKSLDHPGVVRIVDVGTDAQGRSYTVMELLRGETLEARIERGRIELDEFLSIADAIASALDAVHEHGVLHGDLKPANVFLTGDAVVAKLVDFGTSKVHGLERLTRTGEVAGTPTYMAPELLTGEGGIDERIDTYALGVLAYRCLSGEIPFTERNPGRLLFQIVMGEGVPIEERCPALAGDVASVVTKAMSSDRNKRYVRASEFARALREASR